MRITGECMIRGCREQPFSACPFCTVKYCEKHGTVSKHSAWPKSKYPSTTPYPYWPCSICYRRLRDYAHFESLSEAEFVDDAIKLLSSTPQEELEQGFGEVLRPKGNARAQSSSYSHNPTSVRKEEIPSSNSIGFLKVLGAIIFAPFVILSSLVILLNGKYDSKGPP